MTYTSFCKIEDKDAALRKLDRIAQNNLSNTLRILRHANASGIHVYRFSSKLIPLYGHETTSNWPFLAHLQASLEQIGSFVQEHDMRVSFHPDHYVLLNAPTSSVVQRSIDDLVLHHALTEAMGLDTKTKFVLHLGGGYGNKSAAIKRLIANWSTLPAAVQAHVIFENDDRTYTADDTLQLCKTLNTPMVLDVHHHDCNHDDDTDLSTLLPDILATWNSSDLVPKVHVSSSRDERNFRAHADHVNAEEMVSFLDLIRPLNQDIDIMIEAKQKDEALFHLIRELSKLSFVRIVDGGTIQYRP